MIEPSGETIGPRHELDTVTQEDKREASTWPTPVNKREVWPVVASVLAGIVVALVLVWLFI
jgi:hypothetical protein